MCAYTSVIDDAAYVSRWWAPVLAINLSAEVALGDLGMPFLEEIFDVTDERGDGDPVACSDGGWHTEYEVYAVADGRKAIVDNGLLSGEFPLTFKSPAGRLGCGTAVVAEAVRGILRGATSAHTRVAIPCHAVPLSSRMRLFSQL